MPAATGADRVQFGRSDWWTSLGVAATCGVLYGRTLTHGLLIDDSAEFQTMARLFGHTHPTGYEVYTVAAGLAARVPLGDPATRVSAWSAVAACCTVAIVYFIIRQLGAGRIGAVVGALSLAVGTTFWSQAVIAEVYSSGLLLAAVIIGALLRWDETGANCWLVIAGVAGGLSLGVHFTNGLLVPAVVMFIVLSPNRRLGLVPAAGGAVIGTLLAIAAFTAIDLIDPPSQYFDAVVEPAASAWDLEPSSIDGLLERLQFDWTARQFQNQMFSDPVALIPERWTGFRSTILDDFSIAGLLLALVGFVAVSRRSRRVGALFSLSIALQLFYAFNYEIGDLVYVFYLPTFLLVAILLGIGTDVAADLVTRRLPVSFRGRTQRYVAAITIGAVALFSVVSLHLPHVWSATTPPFAFDGYPTESNSREIVFATIADLPDDAVVFTDWGLLYTFVYVAHVEQGRDDLTFHETKPADDSDELAESTFEYVAEVSTGRPVYLTEFEADFRLAGFELVPVRVGPMRMFRVTDRP